MEPRPKVPIWDVKYKDNEGKSVITQVRAHDHLEATSEFRTCWSGLYDHIERIKVRTDPHVAVLE